MYEPTKQRIGKAYTQKAAENKTQELFQSPDNTKYTDKHGATYTIYTVFGEKKVEIEYPLSFQLGQDYDIYNTTNFPTETFLMTGLTKVA